GGGWWGGGGWGGGGGGGGGVGGESVEPRGHGAGARRARRDLAGHERHDLRPDERAARRPHGHRPRVRLADRRLHGADRVRERIARARARARRVRPVMGGVLGSARGDAGRKRPQDASAVVRPG